MTRYFGNSSATTPTSFAVSASTDGGWPTISQTSLYIGGYVYIGSVDLAGNIKVTVCVDTSSGTGTTTTLHATLEADWHDEPTLALMGNGKMIALYSKHAQNGGAAMYQRITVNTIASDPTISAGWAAETNIDSQLGGDAYTYPTVFCLSGDSNKLYLTYRISDYSDYPPDVTARWAMSTSSDNGTTWASQTIFYMTLVHDVPYIHVSSDSVSRLDFVCDGGSANPGKLYHFYQTPSGRFTSDGTAIVASLPLLPASLTQVCSITGSAPVAILTNGSLPVIVVPGLSGSTVTLTYVTWTGSAWNVPSAFSTWTYAAKAWGPYTTIAWESTTSFYAARANGAHWDVFRYVSTDSGVTFTETQISTSPSDDFYPVTVRDARHLRAVWVRGTASSYTSFSLSIEGARL